VLGGYPDKDGNRDISIMGKELDGDKLKVSALAHRLFGRKKANNGKHPPFESLWAKTRRNHNETLNSRL
jgi:hypothetical protein